MDMKELLGGLLKRKSSSNDDIGALVKDLLGGGKKPQQTQAKQPDNHGTVANDVYKQYEDRRFGGRPAVERSELDDDRAKILVVAMVNAAKADGQLDEKEQESILGQLGNVSDAEIKFLRKQFDSPLDVREFSWSVPLGLEEQVYGFSLMAIGLDKNKEADYLKELAHGLRLRPETCNEIHGQFNAPKIF